MPYRDSPAYTNEGSVIVIYGAFKGLQAQDEPAEQVITTFSPERSGDALGMALAAGDFDRDGVADLAMGAPNGNYPFRAPHGFVMVMYGRADHRFFFMRFQPQDAALIQTAASFGWSLAVADFTGDGYDDLAVGVPYQDVDGIVNAGAVMIFYGGERGYFDPAHVFHQNSYHVRDRSETGDNFGWSLAVGDFNADGLADLVIGVPGEDIESTTTIADVGAVAVLSGAPGALSPDPNFRLLPTSRQAGSRFGAGLSR